MDRQEYVKRLREMAASFRREAASLDSMANRLAADPPAVGIGQQWVMDADRIPLADPPTPTLFICNVAYPRTIDGYDGTPRCYHPLLHEGSHSAKAGPLIVSWNNNQAEVYVPQEKVPSHGQCSVHYQGVQCTLFDGHGGDHQAVEDGMLHAWSQDWRPGTP